MSNVRLSVQFEEDAVFAGEEVKCKIVFKNGAVTTAAGSPSAQSPQRGAVDPLSRGSQESSLPLQTARWPRGVSTTRPHLTNPDPRGSRYGHRATKSVAIQNSRRELDATIASTVNARDPRARYGHSRSISIVSLGNTSLREPHPALNGRTQRHATTARIHTRTTRSQTGLSAQSKETQIDRPGRTIQRMRL